MNHDPGFFSGLSVTQVATLVGLFTPLAVAALVKSDASRFIKSIVGVVGVAVGAVVALLTGDNAPDTVTLGVILSAVLPALAAHAGSYYTAWKPTGAAEKVSGLTDRASLIG